MYKLELSPYEYRQFLKKVKCQMIMHDMNAKDLAEKINYSEVTVRHFLSGTKSKLLAYAIADYFDMEEIFNEKTGMG